VAAFVIDGRARLKGRVRPSGNKNAAFPAVAAALLTSEPVTLRNLPDIEDARTMLALVEGLGVSVTRHDPHAVTLHARVIRTTRPNPDLLRKIRGALVLMGPLLAREGRAEFGQSGGDRIGRRRIDSHVMGLAGLGAAMQSDADGLTLSASRLHGQDILLDEASVTATENVILAAVLAEGTTILRHAASEPHVQGLCVLLQSMGAQIEGVGSNLLTIRGGRALTGADFVLGPDFMEIGSFVVLGALAGDEVVIEDVRPDDLRMTLAVFERLGIVTKLRGRDLVVPGEQPLEIRADLGDAIPKVEDGPWPAFPADLMSVALVAATQSKGSVLFHEKMYESRLFFLDRLIGMGAKVVLCDPHRALVQGPARLRGEPAGIPSPDIRAGIALVIAALCAEGRTVIRSIEQIDRGYENIEGKLLSLGARISRVSD
jgi:UDP-N-acetylglucosamine 1-carboxyvinyltransferase